MTSLEYAFLAHAIVDILFGIPLWIKPKFFLIKFGIKDPTESDILMTRLVASALIAIGIASLIGRKSSGKELRIFLIMKIVWSMMAILSLLTVICNEKYYRWVVILLIIMFLAFNVIWNYEYIKILRVE